jgi:succinyl-CoA synthetase alpha subunit
MKEHVELRQGAYADSVTLLQVSRTVQDEPGVLAAQVAMATPLNLEVLTGMGFTVPDAVPDDMVVALRLDETAELGNVLTAVDAALSRSTRASTATTEHAPPRTTAAALRLAPEALVLVSVPGAHALVEAMDALDAGSDVMVFSDNVPLEQEVALKRIAAGRDLLVMGPDCGTAVVGGLGLGFANVTTPGPVGMVAASGTGCQQLLALLGPGQPDLTAAAEAVLRRLGREVPTWPVTGSADPSSVDDRSILQGLFVGGTLCEEARLIAADLLGDVNRFDMVDFGADELTGGRAHPMIDPTLRLEQLAQATADARTGAILLDVVLGHGAEADPGALLAPAVAAAEVPVVVSVVGTAHDPQDLDRQVRVLAEAGAEVHLSNAGATRRAVQLLGGNR